MSKQSVNRRGFITTFSTGAAAVGISILASPLQAAANYNLTDPIPGDPDGWFDQIKGKHRIVFDATGLSEMPFIWSRIFLITNNATGTPGKECSVVVVLRHHASSYALEDSMWQKYKIGEKFKINDPSTKAPAVRNPFWQPAPDILGKLPGVAEIKIGIQELQTSGVLFCVCDEALTLESAIVADRMKSDPAKMKKEWEAAILPGIQLVPSGVWAVGRAQEHKCAYCFAG